MLVPSLAVEGCQYRLWVDMGPLCLMVQGRRLGLRVLRVEGGLGVIASIFEDVGDVTDCS